MVEADGNGTVLNAITVNCADRIARIFILEGLVPIICSLFMWKLLPDSPESARFLEQHEKEYIVNRIAEETGSGHGQVTNKDKIRPHHIWSAFKEWKIWALIIVYLGNSVGVYG